MKKSRSETLRLDGGKLYYLIRGNLLYLWETINEKKS